MLAAIGSTRSSPSNGRLSSAATAASRSAVRDAITTLQPAASGPGKDMCTLTEMHELLGDSEADARAAARHDGDAPEEEALAKHGHDDRRS